MTQIYKDLKDSSIERVVTASRNAEQLKGQLFASASICQALLDCLTEFSTNPHERCLVPMDCSDAEALALTKQVLRRKFDTELFKDMQQKLADFLCKLVVEGNAAPWSHRVELILKLCSENAQTVRFAAIISVKLLEGLVTLLDRVERRKPANKKAGNRRDQERFLAERCSSMVDIAGDCIKTIYPSIFVAEFFENMQRKPFFLKIGGIEKLFCVDATDYCPYACETINAFWGEAKNIRQPERLGFFASPVAIKHIEETMKYQDLETARMAYQLAVSIQLQFPRVMFSNDSLVRIFDADAHLNGIAQLIGRLMYHMNYDVNDGTAFYRKTAQFYGAHAKNRDSARRLIEAGPNDDVWTNWKSIFHYIECVRNEPEAEHAKTMCIILNESAKLLIDRADDASTTKIEGLMNELSQNLQQFTTFTDFNVQCLAAELCNRFLHDAAFEKQFNERVGILFIQMERARGQLQKELLSDDERRQITTDFMGFTAFSVVDTKLEQSLLEKVSKMSAAHLLEPTMYASMRYSDLFGCDSIMLSNCHRLAINNTYRLPASAPHINQVVTCLRNSLGRGGSAYDIDFTQFASFVALSKLIDSVEEGAACAREMLQFVLDKMRAIDAAASTAPETKRFDAMCAYLPSRSLHLIQPQISDLFANLILHCVENAPRKELGIGFLRDSLFTEVPTGVRVAAKILWDIPRIPAKRTVDEMMAKKSSADQLEIQKGIAGEILSRRCLLGMTGSRVPLNAAQKMSNDIVVMVYQPLQMHANRNGSPIKIEYGQPDGSSARVTINPISATGRVTRRAQGRTSN